jgi:hypothetical protein
MVVFLLSEQNFSVESFIASTNLLKEFGGVWISLNKLMEFGGVWIPLNKLMDAINWVPTVVTKA